MNASPRRGASRPMVARLVVLMALAAALFVTSGCRALIDAGNGSSDETSRSANSRDVPASTLPSLPVAPLPVAGKVLPPEKGAYLGVYSPPAPFTLGRIDSFEQQVGKDVSIVMWYQPWATSNRSRFDGSACLEVMRRGKVPMITWEPWDPGSDANLVKDPTKQSKYRLNAITSGRYDAYIRQWAIDIRTLGGPVMLRPMHEMNGNWYPWCGTVNGNSPKEFVKAWRHIHDIFEDEGATNVTWVWSINHVSVPDHKNNVYSVYYPGDEYVDWTSISGFNWGTTSRYSNWQPFMHWYERPIKYLKRIEKPIIISEFGSVEKGGKKDAWIKDAYKRVRALSKVRGVIYYDSIERSTTSTQDWRVNSSKASLKAFKVAIASDYFYSGAPEALSAWASSLDEDDWRYLASLKPIY